QTSLCSERTGTRQASHCGKASHRGSPPRRGRGWVYLHVTHIFGISARRNSRKRNTRKKC
ncbi:MAG: hypothetical protein AVDCRST_MAG56-5691, partial [uncultured Cytophagales bacterium]